MQMQGDGPEDQPGEGVTDLDALADAISGEQEEEEGAPEESGGDESEESEGEEEEAEEEAEPEDEEEEATIVLKHEGKEIPLKQSEVVELAQKGFDYSQKTMAVAKERDAVKAEREKVTSYRQEAEQARTTQLNQLQALEQFYSQQLGDPPPVEWAQQDVAFYVAEKERYEARKGQLDQARSAIGYLQDEQARQRQAWIIQQADECESALKDTLPGWNESTLPELAEYAGKYGLTPKSADVAFVQKGLWEVLHKAKAYDALLAKKAEMKPVNKLVKTVKPSAANPVGKAAARAKREAEFNKNPSVESLAAIFR